MRTRAAGQPMPRATVMSVAEVMVFPFRGPGGLLWAACALGLYAYTALLQAFGAFEAMQLVAYIFLPLPILTLFLVLQLHAWRVLQRLALGHVQAERSISVADISPFQDPLAAQVALLVAVLGGSVATLLALEPALGALCAAALACVLPAFLGVVAVDHAFADALAPQRLWRFVRGLGMAYLPFVAALGTGIAALAIACLALSPPRALLAFAATYLFVLGHAAAGRLMYLRRDALGLATVAPATPAQHEASEVARAVDALMVELHRLCMGGQVRRAARELEDFLRRDDYALDEYVHERVQLLLDQRLMVAHAEHYATRLVAAGRPLPAWRVLRRALVADPGFRPTPANVLLAAVAHAPSQDARMVDAVLSDFPQVYEGDPLVADALLEHARWCVQQLARPDAALACVARIEAEFPAAAARPDVAAFAARLRRHAR